MLSWKMTPLEAGYLAALAGDALAMPVHWYYDREALDRDYPELFTFQAPREVHPDSILWRSSYEPLNEKGDIFGEEARCWGEREVHYHRALPAGQNTVNYQLARELHLQVTAAGGYDARAWAERYVQCMLEPGWHGDTYLEEYHRGFFTRYSQGKDLLKCGIRDEHIGGLSQVPALVAALEGMELGELRPIVKAHVTLTHRHSNVLRAADCLARLMHHIASGQPLREAIMTAAGDWFSTKKALGWEKRPDREIIGQKLSPACYIDQSFPASLYLAWKYHTDPEAALIANAKVGGDSCHRAAVVGALVGCENPGLIEVIIGRFSRGRAFPVD